MQSVYPTVPFKTDDKESLNIYLEQLTQLNFNLCQSALNELIKTNKFCPTFADIHLKMSEIIETERCRKQFESGEISGDCKICDNRGFVLVIKDSEDYMLGDEKLPFAVGAYCDSCARGRQYVYDGRKNENPKYRTLHHTKPISDYRRPKCAKSN